MSRTKKVVPDGVTEAKEIKDYRGYYVNRDGKFMNIICTYPLMSDGNRVSTAAVVDLGASEEDTVWEVDNLFQESTWEDGGVRPRWVKIQ